MSCKNCSKANVIPACVGEIVIGKISDFLTNVYVVFEDITQNRIISFPSTSTGDGTVKIDSSDFMFPENHSYEITITKEIGTPGVEFTIDSTSYPCIGARFRKIRNENGGIETAISHTITMES